MIHDYVDTPIFNLALDRIEEITDAPKEARYLETKNFRPHAYFQDMIGVTRNIESQVEHVTLLASATEAPYIRTKPFHHSQKEVQQMDDGSVLFSLDVILNHELERDLLGYGEGITVLSPQDLSCKIQERLIKTLKKYQTKKET